MKNKMDQEYSFALRPASIEEAGLFYSNDEQDEALGTVGHLRLDFGHGFLPLRSTCYPHNDDQFDTLEFKMLLREFLEAMQENGPLASLSSMEAYCQKHGGAITEDGQTYGYIWETERYRFCLRCTPSPFEYQGHLYCYDLWQQQIQKNCPVGQVTFFSSPRRSLNQRAIRLGFFSVFLAGVFALFWAFGELTDSWPTAFSCSDIQITLLSFERRLITWFPRAECAFCRRGSTC